MVDSVPTELMKNSATDMPLITIGGMGGSGTRLVARIAEVLGYFLGNDLNESHDNLFFTLLFKRQKVLGEEEKAIEDLLNLMVSSLRGDKVLTADEVGFISSLSQSDRLKHNKDWLAERVASRLGEPVCTRRGKVGWKEPNTHVILEHLMTHSSRPKYLHVIRDGMDMALSNNQQQLLLWGGQFLGRPVSNTPADSLLYWNALHRRVVDLQAQFPDRIAFVSYDRLCRYQLDELEKLYAFIDVNPDPEIRNIIEGLIAPPASLNRGKQLHIEQFDAGSIAEYEDLMRLCTGAG